MNMSMSAVIIIGIVITDYLIDNLMTLIEAYIASYLCNKLIWMLDHLKADPPRVSTTSHI